MIHEAEAGPDTLSREEEDPPRSVRADDGFKAGVGIRTVGRRCSLIERVRCH
jgi:hypothetical protein